jgi:acetyl esterase/lipase
MPSDPAQQNSLVSVLVDDLRNYIEVTKPNAGDLLPTDGVPIEQSNVNVSKMRQTRWIVLFCVALVSTVLVQTICVANDAIEIPLWKDGAPGLSTKPEDEPALFLFRPATDAATDAAVIICPGGAYGGLSINTEGTDVASWLNSFGVTGFVLRYRQASTGHHHPTPMLDGQRAVRTVRSRAADWGIDPNKIGVMGFSAGGHLASTLGTHFDAGRADAADAIDHTSSRPDFLVLCFPVISLVANYTHAGSRDNLLGKNPDPEVVRSISNELQVTSETPPTFLFHTDEDTTVPPENSIDFYEALHNAGVPAELHIYRNGGHGVDLAHAVPGTRDWPDQCRTWIEHSVLHKN